MEQIVASGMYIHHITSHHMIRHLHLFGVMSEEGILPSWVELIKLELRIIAFLSLCSSSFDKSGSLMFYSFIEFRSNEIRLEDKGDTGELTSSLPIILSELDIP